MTKIKKWNGNTWLPLDELIVLRAEYPKKGKPYITLEKLEETLKYFFEDDFKLTKKQESNG